MGKLGSGRDKPNSFRRLAPVRLGQDQPLVRPVMPELDAIRGIAILLVLWFHGFCFFHPAHSIPAWERVFLAISNQGWAGVNLFFVLSGFLITGILLDSVSKPNYYSRFYWRRALRILPAYYLLLLILVVVGHISLLQRPVSLAFVGLSFVYLSNVTPLLGVPMQYGPLWSLAVEEHFYLLWPTAVRVLNRWSLAIAAGAICLAEPFLRLYAIHRGGLWWGTYTWLSADGLALGALLAIFVRASTTRRASVLKLAIVVLAITLAAMAISTRVFYALEIAIHASCVNYFALSLVAAILWLGTGPNRGWVNLRILSFFGYISYGLYLIHLLCFDLYDGLATRFFPFFSVGTSLPKSFLRLLVVALFATGLAYLSRITFEEFFLRMKDRRRASVPVMPDSVPTMAEARRAASQ
jgi:peptidoglycan/LPS O-acetylase OafA/YrhL